MRDDGFILLRQQIPLSLIDEATNALLRVGERLGGPADGLDTAWNHFKDIDRAKGGLLYNAAKLLPQIHQLAIAPGVLSALRDNGVAEPSLVDVNFRIDSYGEEKFLFDWHQDYWFSVCSPNAMVFWIPLMPVTTETGGVELISNRDTGGRIFRTAGSEVYRSYADAVRLDEPVPDAPRHTFRLERGDVLMFRFNVLHRSLPVLGEAHSRWTLQARFADLADPAFFANHYKPARVAPGEVPFLKGLN
ncbi:MAG TPA: phytanoyl-CoA dioxygenase family protein [Caulobacteraceae bacterium]